MAITREYFVERRAQMEKALAVHLVNAQEATTAANMLQGAMEEIDNTLAIIDGKEALAGTSTGVSMEATVTKGVKDGISA